jgi:hypothetical protein
MRKHTYTNELAPTNTGSLSRPARFNMRLTCSARARTVKAFAEVRAITEMPKDKSFADVWEERILPAIERMLWNIREAPRGTRNMMLDLFVPLDREDWVRTRYKRLKERFERGEKKSEIPCSLLPGFEV